MDKNEETFAKKPADLIKPTPPWRGGKPVEPESQFLTIEVGPGVLGTLREPAVVQTRTGTEYRFRLELEDGEVKFLPNHVDLVGKTKKVYRQFGEVRIFIQLLGEEPSQNGNLRKVYHVEPDPRARPRPVPVVEEPLAEQLEVPF